MRQKDLYPLLRFLTRPGMYTGEETKRAVVAFVHGYELGTENQCRLTQELNDYLWREYRLPKTAYGWVGQIQTFAEQHEWSWMAAWRRLVLSYIYNHHDLRTEPEVREVLQFRIRNLIDRFREDGAASLRIDEWNGLVDPRQPAFRVLWTEAEWRELESIDRQLSSG